MSLDCLPLEELLAQALSQKGLHISFAESCTAGLAAARLVNVSGVSDVFHASFVTYANEAKIKLVGVSPDTLAKHGAVSENTAREMAEGCAGAAGAEVGVGISGIAGPSGGTPEKPVGTVCFGFYTPHGTVSTTAHFDGDRQSVRAQAVDFAFGEILKLL